MAEMHEPHTTGSRRLYSKATPENPSVKAVDQDAEALGNFLSSISAREDSDAQKEVYLRYYLGIDTADTVADPNLEAYCRHRYAAQETNTIALEEHPVPNTKLIPSVGWVGYTIHDGIDLHQPEGRIYLNITDSQVERMFAYLIQELSDQGISAGVKKAWLPRIPTLPSQMSQEQRIAAAQDIANKQRRLDVALRDNEPEYEVRIAQMDLELAEGQLDEAAVEQQKNRILQDYAEVICRADKIILYFNPDEQERVLAFIDDFIKTNTDSMIDILPRFTSRILSPLGGHLPGVAFAEGAESHASFGELVSVVANEALKAKDYSPQGILSKFATHSRDIEAPAFTAKTAFTAFRQRAA